MRERSLALGQETNNLGFGVPDKHCKQTPGPFNLETLCRRKTFENIMAMGNGAIESKHISTIFYPLMLMEIGALGHQ